MSKISKALERARKQRESEPDQTPETPGDAVHGPLAGTPDQTPCEAPASDETATTAQTATNNAQAGGFQDRRGAADPLDDQEQNRRFLNIGPPLGMLCRRHNERVLGEEDFQDLLKGVSPSHTSSEHQETDEVRKEILEQNRVMTFLDNHSYIDSYNFLRTQILQRTKDSGENCLMVTSVNRGEGKTVTAINLALSISREARQTALLVDANMRNPAVTRYLGLGESNPGLSDYLLNDIDPTTLIIDPGLGSMIRVIPAGKPFMGAPDVLSAPKMLSLVQELKQRYPDRYVIFDCPHLRRTPDSLVFSSYVDGIIMVVAANRTTRPALQQTLELLGDRKIVGMVLNHSRRR